MQDYLHPNCRPQAEGRIENKAGKGKPVAAAIKLEENERKKPLLISERAESVVKGKRVRLLVLLMPVKGLDAVVKPSLQVLLQQNNKPVKSLPGGLQMLRPRQIHPPAMPDRVG
jgi:hypothetical protein